MYRLLYIFISLFFCSYSYSVVTITGTPPTCPAGFPTYQVDADNQTFTSASMISLISQLEQHFKTKYDFSDPPDPWGTVYTHTGVLTDTSFTYFSMTVIIGLEEHVKISPTANPNITNRTQTLSVSFTCGSTQLKCTTDSPDYLNHSTSTGSLQVEPIDGDIQNGGETCFQDSLGDLCSYKIFFSSFHKKSGRNATERNSYHYVVPSTGRNTQVAKIKGVSRQQECSTSFTDAHPFADNYPLSPINGSIAPDNEVLSVDSNGQKTFKLLDGSTVKIVPPTVENAVSGGCSTIGTCLSMFESLDGKDHLTIVASEPLPEPDSILEATLDVYDLETGEKTEIEVYTSPTLDSSTIQVNQNSPDSLASTSTTTITSNNSLSVLSGGLFGGSGDGSVDVSGDVSGDASGETPTETIVTCGGSSGVSCETTQKNVLIELKKLVDDNKATLSGGSLDCQTNPSCTGNTVPCARLLINWRSNCLNKTASSSQLSNSDQYIKQLAIDNGVQFDSNGVAVIPTTDINVSQLLDTTGFETASSIVIPPVQVMGKTVSLDLSPIESLFIMLGSLVMISVGVFLYKSL